MGGSSLGGASGDQQQQHSSNEDQEAAAASKQMPTWLLSSRQQAAAVTSQCNEEGWGAAPAAAGHSHQQHQHQQQQQASSCSYDNRNNTGTSQGLLQDDNEKAEVHGGDMASVEDLNECARLQSAKLKADIVTHPLYEQLLEAHVSCLRIATPVDQLGKIDGQIAQCHQVIAKYYILANHQLLCGNTKDELDQFMAHYVMLLRSFKEQLQHHVRVHAKEAVMACWELEQSLLGLTGVSPGEGSGATMSEDETEQQQEQQCESDFWQDNLGFGPLIPTETERTLMERVRQELKHELKHGYRARIVDVREEILRKRRAGKLPGDTTSVLKAWWHAHSKWPYPTEDEKARLVQETGLELKQINNWFINQRKRNWHHHPSTSTSTTSKLKCKS